MGNSIIKACRQMTGPFLFRKNIIMIPFWEAAAGACMPRPKYLKHYSRIMHQNVTRCNTFEVMLSNSCYIFFWVPIVEPSRAKHKTPNLTFTTQWKMIIGIFRSVCVFMCMIRVGTYVCLNVCLSLCLAAFVSYVSVPLRLNINTSIAR